VSATATLEKVEGRKLYFKIIAHQGDVVIGEGTHLRFIVSREKFLAKF
jgi:predicted thioesterase